MNKQDIVMEHVYDAPIARVWKAITDRDEMQQWYFNVPEFKAEVGFRFEFSASEDPATPYVHLCEVTEVINGKKLTYSWRYKDYPGDSSVTWELFEQGDKTLLRLTHTGLATFPAGNPNFERSSFNAGWTFILGTSLKNFLESTPAKP